MGGRSELPLGIVVPVHGARITGATFASASLITPFFMGTVVGAVATGRVPVHPSGNVLGAWTSPTAILTGFLFVAACAYVSAAFLVVEARQRGHQDLTRYFVVRATAAGVITGLLPAARSPSCRSARRTSSAA
jgi:cytochrome bd ubiquinol oxidase subunit II